MQTHPVHHNHLLNNHTQAPPIHSTVTGQQCVRSHPIRVTFIDSIDTQRAY